MPIYILVALFLTLFGADFYLSESASSPAETMQDKARVVAQNMGVYDEAAEQYALANPTASGVFTLADLAPYLPTGYAPMEAWEAYRSPSGQLIVTEIPTTTLPNTRLPTDLVARYAAQLKGKGLGAGYSIPGYVVSPYSPAGNLPLDPLPSETIFAGGRVVMLILPVGNSSGSVGPGTAFISPTTQTCPHTSYCATLSATIDTCKVQCPGAMSPATVTPPPETKTVNGGTGVGSPSSPTGACSGGSVLTWSNLATGATGSSSCAAIAPNMSADANVTLAASGVSGDHGSGSADILCEQLGVSGTYSYVIESSSCGPPSCPAGSSVTWQGADGSSCTGSLGASVVSGAMSTLATDNSNVGTATVTCSPPATTGNGTLTVTSSNCANPVPPPINGSCGYQNGATVSAPPAGSAACSIGTLLGPSGYGPWTWSCLGSNGGSSASCFANAGSCTNAFVIWSSGGATCGSTTGSLASGQSTGVISVAGGGYGNGTANALCSNGSWSVSGGSCSAACTPNWQYTACNQSTGYRTLFDANGCPGSGSNPYASQCTWTQTGTYGCTLYYCSTPTFFGWGCGGGSIQAYCPTTWGTNNTGTCPDGPNGGVVTESPYGPIAVSCFAYE